MVAVHHRSCSLTKNGCMYRTFEKKSAAVFLTLKKFRRHIFGDPFFVCSGYTPLRSAFDNVDICGRLVIWLDIIEKLAFEIYSVENMQNFLADYRSHIVGEE